MREFQCENSENIRAVSLLLEESESLADENEKMRLLIARAMEYGVNGSRCYSASEACRTGDAMRDILSNVPRQVSLAGGAGGSQKMGAQALGLLFCQQALCLSGGTAN